MARIITITSGKGGVGKTSISLNLSLALATEGFKVCLFDADLGLANVNILTGLYPQKDLESVISGRAPLTGILIRDYQGIDIIPGASGVERLAGLTRAETGILIRSFLDLEAYDFFIFDTSAGISPQVLAFCMASHEIILVVTTEPTSLTDAYSMLKVLSKHGYDSPVKVIVNQAAAGKAAQKAYARLKQTVTRFLPARIEPLGIVASDKNVRASVIAQTPFFLLFPDTVASRCVAAIAEKLIRHHGKAGDIPLELFWDHCLSFLERHSPRKNEKTRDARTGETTPDLDERLSRMEEKLSFLVKEMADIRELLETRVPAAARAKESPCPEPRNIILDFESWLAAKKG
jgi:flagellar biosynthesis protein FlhG